MHLQDECAEIVKLSDADRARSAEAVTATANTELSEQMLAE